MTRPQNREVLVERLLTLIGRGVGAPFSTEDFNILATEIFAYQFEGNAIYRAYCGSRGIAPADAVSWLDIPALPADAFKAAPLLCGDPATAAAVFRTSGTSQGSDRRGTHYFLDTGLYEAALNAGFSAHLLPDRNRMRTLSLIPSRGEAPDSSLSFMISEVIETFGTSESGFYVADGELQVNAFVDAAIAAMKENEPVLVAGTSFAFVHLLEALAESHEALSLPLGSRAMDTGGFKARSREVSQADLYRGIRDRLGIDQGSIVNEYGMTEMSSQLYDGVAGTAGLTADGAQARLHRSPAWVRSVAVDPESLAPLPAGEIGVLRHLDLANLDSIAAIQTADLGRVMDTGIELLGRARGAEARGCSLAMEDLVAVMERSRRL